MSRVSGERFFRHYRGLCVTYTCNHGLRPRLDSYAATAAETHNHYLLTDHFTTFKSKTAIA